jgi:hypothetical protein
MPYRALSFIMLVILLGACNSTVTPVPISQTESPANTLDTAAYPYPYPSVDLTADTSGYPAPSLNNSNPYPIPTADYSVLLVEVTPNPTMGQVSGEILLKGKPLPFQTFFLADVLKDNKTGMELATSLDRSTAPKTISNENGVFSFMNVPPGRYGLIFISATDTYLLLYPGKQEAILVTVEAGGKIDLGVLDFEDLPVD